MLGTRQRLSRFCGRAASPYSMIPWTGNVLRPASAWAQSEGMGEQSENEERGLGGGASVDDLAESTLFLCTSANSVRQSATLGRPEGVPLVCQLCRAGLHTRDPGSYGRLSWGSQAKRTPLCTNE